MYAIQRPSGEKRAAYSSAGVRRIGTGFASPVSGNIQWREVESLLHHLGATSEPLSGARIRVRLNGVEGILHRPHHGDALGRQDILHVREYLAHARATPSQYEERRKG